MVNLIFHYSARLLKKNMENGIDINQVSFFRYPEY